MRRSKRMRTSFLERHAALEEQLAQVRVVDARRPHRRRKMKRTMMMAMRAKSRWGPSVSTARRGRGRRPHSKRY